MENFTKLIFDKVESKLNIIDEQVEDYKVDALIGKGTGGKVYRIKGKNEVIKIVPINDDTKSEIAIQQCLASEYILPILKVEETKKDFLIRYPFGLSLRHLLEMKSLFNYDEKNPYYDLIKQYRVDWAKQIALGLLHIHSYDIIHLDINPCNIIILPENGKLKAVIADFGISQFINGGTFGRSGNAVVTKSYRDINISCGVSYKTSKVDVWSYGMTLLKLFFDTDINDYDINDNDSFKDDVLNKAYLDGYDKDRYLEDFQDAMWIARRIFTYTKIPRIFKMFNFRHRHIFNKFDELEEPIDYVHLLDSETLKLKGSYYTEEKWSDIFLVINACLNLDMYVRPEMYRLLSYKLIYTEVKDINYKVFKDIENKAIDYYFVYRPIKQLTKIWLKRIKDEKLIDYDFPVTALLREAAEILGYNSLINSPSLNDLNINLRKLFPNGVFENCFIKKEEE